MSADFPPSLLVHRFLLSTPRSKMTHMIRLQPIGRVQRSLVLLAVVLIGLMALVGVVYINRPQPIGTPINPPQVMPDFELYDQNGTLTHLNHLSGKAVVMIFGYTHCPDICPLGLVNFKRIKAALGDRASQVQFVLVSVDGDRDTPAVMKRYLSAFDLEFIGLTERAFVVAQVAAPYGARFERKITHTNQTEYAVGHTTDTYLLDSQGRLLKKYAYTTNPEQMAQDIARML